MQSKNDDGVTDLLNKAAAGDAAAASELFQLVNETLRGIARQRMLLERKDHTLQTTALVNEAWMKLMGDKPIAWSSRGQFYATAADVMRNILIDHARQRNAVKRGGGIKRATVNIEELAARGDPEEILALIDAISRLEKEEPDLAKVINLRFFAGLTIEETAAALGQSARGVDRLWSYARARLFRMLKSED